MRKFLCASAHAQMQIINKQRIMGLHVHASVRMPVLDNRRTVMNQIRKDGSLGPVNLIPKCSFLA